MREVLPESLDTTLNRVQTLCKTYDKGSANPVGDLYDILNGASELSDVAIPSKSSVVAPSLLKRQKEYMRYQNFMKKHMS